MARNVGITIINDDIVEPLESFRLSLRIPPRFANMGIRHGTPATAIGFIIDDDGMYYAFMYNAMSEWILK